MLVHETRASCEGKLRAGAEKAWGDDDDDDDGGGDDDDGGGDGSPCYGFTPKKYLYCDRRVLIPTGASGLHTHRELNHEDDDVALHTYPRRSRWT